MFYILERMKERSSWFGLTALLTASGVSVMPELQESIVSAGVGLAGLISFFTSEDK